MAISHYSHVLDNYKGHGKYCGPVYRCALTPSFAVAPYSAVLDFIAFPEFFPMGSHQLSFGCAQTILCSCQKHWLPSHCLLLSISGGDNACLNRGIWIYCVLLCTNADKVGPESHFSFVLIACDCSDPVPVDSAACVIMCSLFICLCRGHFLSTCNRAGTVGRLWGIQVWFLLWKCFYNKGGQELRALQIYPFYCIIPPCHQRDSYPFEEIQQAFAKANKKTPGCPSQCPYCDV